MVPHLSPEDTDGSSKEHSNASMMACCPWKISLLRSYVSPSCLHGLSGCLGKLVHGGHAWGSQDPCWQHSGRKAGESSGDTQKPASPQALCSVILQLLSSGSWTQATETFMVVNAPNTYLPSPILQPKTRRTSPSLSSQGLRGCWGWVSGLNLPMTSVCCLTQLRAAGVNNLMGR